MRNGHGFNKKFLESWLHRRLDFLDPAHQVFNDFARAFVQQGNARAGTGGVPRRTHVTQNAIGNHAQHHGVFHVDMAAKSTGQADAIDLLHAHALHQKAHTRVQRGFAQLDGAHVVLQNPQCGFFGGSGSEFVAEGAAVWLDARGARGQVAVNRALVADDAGQIHLGQRFDDARAANAGHAGVGYRSGKAGVVRPQVATDHFVTRLQGHRVDAHALNRTGRGALTAADLRAFKRRAGGAGAGQHALVIAQHNLGIGSHIHQQSHRRIQVRPLGQDHSGGIGTHMTGDTGQHINTGVAVDREVNFRGPQGDGAVGRQRKRRAAQLHRVDTQQQVVHDGITDKGGFQNIGGLRPDPLRHLHRQGVERLAHSGGHLDLAARIHHHVRHPAHQVFAKADLRVHHASRGQHIARGQITQMGGDGGGSHIHRKPVGFLMQSRPHSHDLFASMHRHGDLPGPCAQRGLQLLHHQNVACQIGQRPLELQRIFQAAQITRRVVHVRLLDFHKVQADQRVEVDVMRLGFFAHHLFVDLAAGGHVDHHIALHLRAAGQAAAFGERLGGAIGFLYGGNGRHMRGTGDNAVFGEFAFGHQHLAAPANTAPTAHRIDVDTERAPGLQQGRTQGETPPSPRGREND